MTEALAVRERQEVTEFEVADLVAQVTKIQHVMKSVMRENEHYGVIPGTSGKPSLLKPGAEKLGLTFRLAPKFFGENMPRDLGRGHREYIIRCELYSIVSERFCGAGLGSCSTMESKYRYRTGPKESTGRPIPADYWNLRKTEPERALALIGGRGHTTGKDEGGSWVIMRQGEKVENPDPADQYNTVLKMAKKRAHVDAILTATAASDIFTQDLEDLQGEGDTQNARQTGEQDRGASAPRSVNEAPPPPPSRVADPSQEQPPEAGERITPNALRMLHARVTAAQIPEDIMRTKIKEMGYTSSKEIRQQDLDGLLKWIAEFGREQGSDDK